MAVDLSFVTPNGEPLILRIIGRQVYFVKTVNGLPMMSTIDGIKLNVDGMVKQFPDLEGKPVAEMRREAISRFKEHIKSLTTDDEVIKYLREDLEKSGYKLLLIQRAGHRPERVE
jgi:hypothetical protein